LVPLIRAAGRWWSTICFPACFQLTQQKKGTALMATTAVAVRDAETASVKKASKPKSPPFSAEQVTVLHADDRLAATIIVCLLTGIFTIGLIGYIAICFWSVSE
jgi:hypothetical protein